VLTAGVIYKRYVEKHAKQKIRKLGVVQSVSIARRRTKDSVVIVDPLSHVNSLLLPLQTINMVRFIIQKTVNPIGSQSEGGGSC